MNALWGKCVQRPECDTVHYTRSPQEFHRLFEDVTGEIVHFEHINDHVDRVVVRRRAPFAKAPPTNNLPLGCSVTVYARIELWMRLEEIRQNGGILCYCDTDSAIHARRRNAPPCIAEGDALGQMKRELVGRRILEYLSAGAKNHGELHVDEVTGGDELVEQKIRGIELTYSAGQILDFERMRRLILDYFGQG